MNDYKNFFEFENFQPSSSQQRELRRVLEDILWQSPSDASLKIKVIKSTALYHIQCVISSSSGRFAAQGVSENFTPALQLMTSGIQRELSRWKQTRSFCQMRVGDQQVS